MFLILCPDHLTSLKAYIPQGGTMKRILATTLATAAALTIGATAVTAQSAKDFCEGKTVEIYGYGLGGPTARAPPSWGSI